MLVTYLIVVTQTQVLLNVLYNYRQYHIALCGVPQCIIIIMHCVKGYMRFVALHVSLILGVKVLHNNSCNIRPRAIYL